MTFLRKSEVNFRVYLIILLVAAIGDLLIPTLISSGHPGYSHLRHTISTLGTDASPVQTFQCLNLMIVGTLFMLFSYGQYTLFRPLNWAKRLYVAGIVLFGVGTVFAGLFPEDPRGVDETVSGKVHGVTSGIGFLFLILNPLWANWIKEFDGMRRAHPVFLLLAAATFAAFMVSETVDEGIFIYAGLFQRLNLLVLYVYLVLCFIESGKYAKDR